MKPFDLLIYTLLLILVVITFKEKIYPNVKNALVDSVTQSKSVKVRL